MQTSTTTLAKHHLSPITIITDMVAVNILLTIALIVVIVKHLNK